MDSGKEEASAGELRSDIMEVDEPEPIAGSELTSVCQPEEQSVIEMKDLSDSEESKDPVKESLEQSDALADQGTSAEIVGQEEKNENPTDVDGSSELKNIEIEKEENKISASSEDQIDNDVEKIVETVTEKTVRTVTETTVTTVTQKTVETVIEEIVKPETEIAKQQSSDFAAPAFEQEIDKSEGKNNELVGMTVSDEAVDKMDISEDESLDEKASSINKEESRAEKIVGAPEESTPAGKLSSIQFIKGHSSNYIFYLKKIVQSEATHRKKLSTC